MSFTFLLITGFQILILLYLYYINLTRIRVMVDSNQSYYHLDPEMLEFDVAIVSIPQCCGFAFQDSSDDDASLCSCGNATASSFSDIEHCIAKGNVINDLIFPDQLNRSK